MPKDPERNYFAMQEKLGGLQLKSPEKSIIISEKDKSPFEGQFHLTSKERSRMHQENLQRVQKRDKEIQKKEKSDQKKRKKAKLKQEKMLDRLEE